MRHAFIFPGQGSQYLKMGYDLYQEYAVARKIFQRANDSLGFDIARLCFEGPEEKLMETMNTQPAVLTVSIACLAVLNEHQFPFRAVAGHSLGEYSALVAAGSLTFEDAVRLVHKRGRLMQEAVPIGTGGMVAVIGLDRDGIEKVCTEAGDEGVVEIANLNSPQQIVIAGEMPALNRAMELAKEAGAKRTVMLPVSAPFHCSLMKPVAIEMEKHLSKIIIDDPVCGVVSNVTAGYVRDAREVRNALIQQISSPVLWTDSINLLVEDGIDAFVEVGPGRVLTGLVKRINRKIKTTYVQDSKTLNDFLAG
ncbi:MAG TPA: ACP S-malonyltransferase [Clostridia bacterium]|nr:ACP S-malonyltransferase [Clostridia bacterium]